MRSLFPKPSEPAAGPVPWGLVGMLAILLAVESVVARHTADFSNYLVVSWEWSRRAAQTRQARKADVLCFGDSLVNLGVLPHIIDERSGKRVYNLSVYAGQASSSYFLLRRALEAGARPSAVVVDFHSNLLSASPKSSRPCWPRLVDLRDSLDLLWCSRDVGLFATTLGAWLAPTFDCRRGVRASLLAALRGDAGPSNEEAFALRRNLRLNCGATVSALDPGRPREIRGTDARHWSPRPVNVTYVHRFMALARAHGITVYWLIPPATPGWQARRDAMGLEMHYTRFVERVQARHPNVIVLDGRQSGYPERVFADDTHLNRLGASELSAVLGRVLASHQSGAPPDTRWCHLPPFQNQPADLALEDLNQSTLAVRTMPTRFR